MRIVFVGGVHGSGKTTLSRRLAECLSATHVTAGSLIREAAGSDTVTIGRDSKAVRDMNANQTLLLQGLTAYKNRYNTNILLDGHFSLLQPDGQVIEIPLAVYRTIAPAAVVLVQANPHVVYERLVQRDGTAPPLATLLLLLEREYTNARSVCVALSVPFLTTQSEGDPEGVVQALASRLSPILGDAA